MKQKLWRYIGNLSSSPTLSWKNLMVLAIVKCMKSLYLCIVRVVCLLILFCILAGREPLSQSQPVPPQHPPPPPPQKARQWAWCVCKCPTHHLHCFTPESMSSRHAHFVWPLDVPSYLWHCIWPPHHWQIRPIPDCAGDPGGQAGARSWGGAIVSPQDTRYLSILKKPVARSQRMKALWINSVI